ncbi:MAG: valine--tRNA ligase, partial [Acidobacteria bacterium]|nr:valine--tRNA ligase [Acidobacteriota bacterium]
NERDSRYQHLQGKRARLPLINREIPIITDELAQPEFGTGAVKVTPAHDANDFAAGLRHNLPAIEVMDEHARMNENAGPYQGRDRYEARKRVLDDLRKQNFLVGEKDYTIVLGSCQRCGTVVEPRLSTQWFLKIQPLAERAIEVVERDYIRFTPVNYRQIYLNWMRNIHDWCISRQLWWGHRIPAWYCSCGEVIVAREAPTICSRCRSSKLEQDADVLDTWFSSGLLPFTALGWPRPTRDLEVFYPTQLLITGFDILFFWVARMIMLGCWFMAPPHKPSSSGTPTDSALDESVPFREVYIHGLVRDAERQKMSKTKGNVLDPIAVIEKYGTDATRFTLAAMSSPGTDIAFNESRTDGYRAFANKIWNAARFLFMNLDRLGLNSRDVAPQATEQPSAGLAGFCAVTLEDRWILSRFHHVSHSVNESLAAYRFDEAANSIYDFFWGEFCDWYIELIKPRLAPECGDQARVAATNLVTVFEAALRLLHPIMPFITDEIWHALYDEQPPLRSAALANYPIGEQKQIDRKVESHMAILEDMIVAVRNLRAERKIESKAKVDVEVFVHEPEIRMLIENNRGSIERLANVADLRFEDHSLEKLAGVRHTSRFDVRLLYEAKIDVAAECDKLQKELERLDRELSNGQRQLDNEQFLAKAPKEVVEKLRRRLEEVSGLVQTIGRKRQELKCLG